MDPRQSRQDIKQDKMDKRKHPGHNCLGRQASPKAGLNLLRNYVDLLIRCMITQRDVACS